MSGSPAPVDFNISKYISHSPTHTDVKFRKVLGNLPSSVDLSFSKSVTHNGQAPVVHAPDAPQGHAPVLPQTSEVYKHVALGAGGQSDLPSHQQPDHEFTPHTASVGGTFDQLLRLAKSPAISTLISNNPNLVIRLLQGLTGSEQQNYGAPMRASGGDIDALLNFAQQDPELVRKIIKNDPDFIPSLLGRIIGGTSSEVTPQPPQEDADTNTTSEDTNVPENVPVDADVQQAYSAQLPQVAAHTNYGYPSGYYVQPEHLLPHQTFGFPATQGSVVPSYPSAYYHVTAGSDVPPSVPGLNMDSEVLQGGNEESTSASSAPATEAPSAAQKAQDAYAAQFGADVEEDSKRPALPAPAGPPARAAITEAAPPPAVRPVYVPARGHYRFDPLPEPARSFPAQVVESGDVDSEASSQGQV
ncbi:uncharacterized protein LOC135398711 [Ornithodoros turicata]|uniref:uncharacterized protein LOC135398711 n=1 Tax=Ornithodoros turicata TaxID=34597 RepID=UPI00313894D0